MALYEIEHDRLTKIKTTTFTEQGIKERDDLQRLLKKQIGIIAPDTLIIAEEFGEWEDSKRRVDLLGLDKQANIVVIELKRTEDGGHMELQSIRYAAMVSNLTFDKAVNIFERYLEKTSQAEVDAEQTMLDFLGWDSVEDESFAKDVRIVLASQEFSKEITSSVLWLNSRDLDIQCIRLQPYRDGARTLLDVQTVIPLPETAQYQVQIREKQKKERASRESNRDFTKYDLTVSGVTVPRLNKRKLMHAIAKAVVDKGMTPEDFASYLKRGFDRTFIVMEGTLSGDHVGDRLMEDDPGGKYPRTVRYFCQSDELFHINGKTYVMSNQWGIGSVNSMLKLISDHPELEVEFRAVEC